jgi:hypothetical protein
MSPNITRGREGVCIIISEKKFVSFNLILLHNIKLVKIVILKLNLTQ